MYNCNEQVHEACYGWHHLSETKLFVINCNIRACSLAKRQYTELHFALAIAQTNQMLRQMSLRPDKEVTSCIRKHHFCVFL